MKELKDNPNLKNISHLQCIKNCSSLHDPESFYYMPNSFHDLDSTGPSIRVHVNIDNNSTPYFVSLNSNLDTVMAYLASVDEKYTQLLGENFDKVINFLDMMDN